MNSAQATHKHFKSLFALALSLTWVLWSHSAWAQQTQEESAPNDPAQAIQAGPSTPSEVTRDDECQAAYSRLYQNPILRISAYFGYSNIKELVYDKVQRSQFEDKLTGICPVDQSTQLCGFSKDSENPNLLTKEIIGPDQRPRTVEIRLGDSAYTIMDAVNKNHDAQAQNQKSAATKKNFLSALTTDDVVFYIGHARYGTGPGFYPLRNQDFIHAVTKPDLYEMLTVLKNSQHKPQIFGMLACETKALYGATLHQTLPNAALILTNQTTMTDDSIRTLETSVDDLLAMKCQKDFNQDLKRATKYLSYSGNDLKKNDAEKFPVIAGFFQQVGKRYFSRKSILLHYIKEHIAEDTTDFREIPQDQEPEQK